MTVLDTTARFSLAYYQNTVAFEAITGSAPGYAFLISSAVADGTLAQADHDQLSGGIADAIRMLPGNSGCTFTPVTMDITDPWEHGGAAGLAFDSSWVISGFHVEGADHPSMTNPVVAKYNGVRKMMTHMWFAARAGSTTVADSIPGLLKQVAVVSLVRGPVPQPKVTPGWLYDNI